MKLIADSICQRNSKERQGSKFFHREVDLNGWFPFSFLNNDVIYVKRGGFSPQSLGHASKHFTDYIMTPC